MVEPPESTRCVLHGYNSQAFTPQKLQRVIGVCWLRASPGQELDMRDNIADFFTKPMKSANQFHAFRKTIMNELILLLLKLMPLREIVCPSLSPTSVRGGASERVM